MLNLNQFKEYIENNINLNGFNLAEYQDKYYFQKKVLEVFPQMSEKDIYDAIDKSIINNQSKLKDSFTQIISELFKLYSSSANDSNS